MITAQAEWLRVVVRVGDGRGFVIEPRTGHGRRIITAAHCLPFVPPPHPGSYLEERTFKNLIGQIGDDPQIWAQCDFVDPVADLAVLCCPDEQELPEEADQYETLVEEAAALPIGGVSFTRSIEPDFKFAGQPKSEMEAWLLSLNRRWFACKVKSLGRSIWIADAVEPIRGGMSGSPIVASN